MSDSVTTLTRHASARHASTEDLLTVLLAGRGGRGPARKKAARLLAACGGLAGLARLGEGVRHVEDLAPVAADRLAAAFELGLRCAQPTGRRTAVIACSDDIVAQLGPRLRHLMHEQVWMIGLDARNVVLATCRIAEGGQHGCALLARDVLRVAVQIGAHSFVLAHNHPGGDPRPSAEDVHLTEQIASAAACVGIPLIDHVIVTRSGHSSLLNLGLVPNLTDDLADRLPTRARVAGPRTLRSPDEGVDDPPHHHNIPRPCVVTIPNPVGPGCRDRWSVDATTKPTWSRAGRVRRSSSP